AAAVETAIEQSGQTEEADRAEVTTAPAPPPIAAKRSPMAETGSTAGEQVPAESITSTATAGSTDRGSARQPATGERSHSAAPIAITRPTRTEGETATTATAVDIDRGLDWNQCFPWSTPAPLSFSPPPTTELLIDADSSVMEQTLDQISIEGNVAVRQADSLLEADTVHYQRAAETLNAEGSIYYERPGLRLTAAQAHFDLAMEQGELQQVSYRLTDSGGRGEAELAVIESRDLTHLKQIDYTTCKPGDNGWLLQAEELDIDKATGVGTARHAKLHFKGVPFLYLPYASFPIDDRRKSGFLFPRIGESERNGLDIAVPYYFNIAPNMDATLTARTLSKRGVLLGGEFNYLQERHDGRVRAEFLPNDHEVRDDVNQNRGAFSYQASGRPAAGWRFDADVNYVSDNDYLDDLGDSLAVTSARHLERLGQLSYTGSDWSILGKAQYYQTIDDSISINDKPYSRIPQLLFDFNRPRQAYGLTYQLQSEYVYFIHTDNDRVYGQRFDIQPSLSLPLTREWGFLTPKVSLKYTKYALENQAAGNDEAPDRLLPSFSLDTGLFFERTGNWFSEAIVQTLEPRLFYLYTPYEEQSDLPEFDSSDVTFSFASLFRENRFSGNDRVGDANQLTAALTTRILSDSSGAELLSASIGQTYYFLDRKVQTGSNPTDNGNHSSLAAELSSRIGHWSLNAALQWDPDKGSKNTEKGAFTLRYDDHDERIFNAGYNFTRGIVEQTDLSALWPIGDRWGLVGRWTYSHHFDETVLAFAGIEYDDCCWRVRLIGQQLLTDIGAKPDNSILLQFQLKGLGGWGRADNEFLESNIAGYRANR
ncbi:MAG: LPS-assembly protein LptD, partial [Gammaproteobacteria bacterium]|nr:LPS-assembly protein LptD [Gammaproteobacteria bacterium]